MTDSEIPTVGALLRTRRLDIGVSLDEVAARTRIRRRYLTALEEDRFDLLPGEAYLAGFLRGYAEELRLPAAPLLDLCREQASRGGKRGETGRRPSSRALGAQPKRSGWPVWMSAVLFAAALILAHFTLGGNRKGAPDFISLPPAADPPSVLQTLWLPRLTSGPLSPQRPAETILGRATSSAQIGPLPPGLTEREGKPLDSAGEWTLRERAHDY